MARCWRCSGWLDHFVVHVPGGVSPDNPVLLLLDSHSSRTAPGVIAKAKRLGVEILLPPGSLTALNGARDAAAGNDEESAEDTSESSSDEAGDKEEAGGVAAGAAGAAAGGGLGVLLEV
ncbi:hypothetical protein HXX76_016210 [Chlamydomonas incerta]|uniref:DDE-1 domain-containing protein n=1 Tax=Chlamydomonas incerta TaxID=51695 RepID=A0A835SKU2_CHLIN|nr:hypothetical protein HXX76_016210 [Chlamydomonas incerta]|eukprot:KAG2422210.1 hypothetical protein HXX76_016210 [Chlamydomonas incerta]